MLKKPRWFYFTFDAHLQKDYTPTLFFPVFNKKYLVFRISKTLPLYSVVNKLCTVLQNKYFFFEKIHEIIFASAVGNITEKKFKNPDLK